MSPFSKPSQFLQTGHFAEIAEALNLSLQHIQNYQNLDWLAQRSLQALMKGRTQELNKQLKMLLTVGGAKAGGRYRGPKKKLKRLQAQARRPKAKGAHPVQLLNIGPTQHGWKTGECRDAMPKPLECVVESTTKKPTSFVPGGETLRRIFS